MALRKASVYKPLERPYTRKSKVKSKSYIKTIPPPRITKFSMGDASKRAKHGFMYEISLVAKEGYQIRDNTLEAARQLAHRYLEVKFGKDFYFGINVYPHHILREHKIAAVAQSDRFFSGMSHPFGKTVSNAAQVHKGTAIMTTAINGNEQAIAFVRHVYHMARSKLGCSAVTVVKKMN